MNDQSPYPAPLPRPRAFCAAWARDCLAASRRYRHDRRTAAYYREMAREWIAEGKSGSVALRRNVIYNARAGNRPANEGQER